MDEDREIRFLISPFFFYSSLLWWAYVNPQTYRLLSGLKPESFKDFISIIAVAGAATLPLGYSIGLLTTLILRGLFAIRNIFARGERQVYEAHISEASFRAILSHDTAPNEDRKSLLFAAATFDHSLLPQGVHKWLMRRWSAFSIASSSALALLISICVVPIRMLYTWSLDPAHAWDHKLWWWLSTNVVLICLLVLAAFFAWKETMGMLEFQSRRKSLELPASTNPDGAYTAKHP